MRPLEKQKHKKESLSWFQKLWKPQLSLADLLQNYRFQITYFKEKKEGFIQFLLDELADLQIELEEKLNEENVIAINVPEAYGFFCFLTRFQAHRKSKNNEKIVLIKLNEVIKDANQIALIILKELGQKPSKDNLEQLKEFTQNGKFLIIIDQVSYLPTKELKVILSSLKSAKVLLVNSQLTYSKTLENYAKYILDIPLLTVERAVELATLLLRYRGDLIVTTADRKELITLVNLCGRLPEMIYMAFAGLQKQGSITLDKFIKEVQKQAVSAGSPIYYYWLSYFEQELPTEISYCLQKAYFLPASGFSLNDLYVLCREKISSKEEMEQVLQFMAYVFPFEVSYSESLIIYSLPEFLRIFIRSNLLLDFENEKNELNSLLIQRLESNILWQEPRIWVSQLEQTLIAFEWIGKQKNYDKNRYFILYIQSVLIELGLWKEVERILIPLCHHAINDSENNEDRGFWYSLLGLIHREISKFQDANKQLDLALNALHKSLKFYDPQKQFKRYSFVYQNIGLVYNELSKINNTLTYLKQALKAYYKALGDDKKKDEATSITLKRLLAETYYTLGKSEKPLEHFQKSYSLYKQAIQQLPSDQADSRFKLFQINLTKLLKQVKFVANESADPERSQLNLLKTQIEELVQTAADALPANN